MDSATIIGMGQLGLLFAIALQLGALRAEVKEHGRRLVKLESGKWTG